MLTNRIHVCQRSYTSIKLGKYCIIVDILITAKIFWIIDANCASDAKLQIAAENNFYIYILSFRSYVISSIGYCRLLIFKKLVSFSSFQSSFKFNILVI